MSAWPGVAVGALLGGAAGWLFTRRAPDPGVIGAAAGAGALIGGALAGPSAAAAEGPTLTSVPLTGSPSVTMKVGDVVDLIAPAGLAVSSVDAHGSDAVSVDISTSTMAVVRALKPKSTRLDATLSNGSLVVVQATVSA